MPRTKQQYQEIRKVSKQKILDAALEVFANEGYHSSAVSSIAKTAGISKGLLYNYFKSKEDVLNELMLGMFDEFMDEIIPLKPGEKLNREHIIHFINKSIDLVLEKPKFWKLYFGVFVQPDVMSMLMKKVMDKVSPYMISLAQYFKQRGDEDPIATMRYFSAIMDGIQFHIIIDPETFPAEKIKQLMIKQFT
jgi:AcrR family transcriptional regulator